MPSNKALFLDRDGVINIDHGYVYQAENFEFMPGIFALCQRFQSKGYKLIVATNQSGIGRGYYSEEQFHVLTDWMLGEFNNRGVCIEQVYFCPHHAEHGLGKYKQDSVNRKPHPGMLLTAAKEHNLDLSQSLMIGDKISDMHAAAGAGLKKAFLLSDKMLDAGAIDLNIQMVPALEQIQP